MFSMFVFFKFVCAVMWDVLLLQVYAWGSGPCIGCGVETIALRPKVIDDFQNVCIVDISCGDSHCLALSNGILRIFWCYSCTR